MEQPAFIYTSTRHRRRRGWLRFWPRIAGLLPVVLVLNGAVLTAAAVARIAG